MILKTALAIKLLLPLFLLAGGYLVLRRRLHAGRLLGMGALVVLFAFAANGASGLVPTLRDEVTLTALGEKNDAAAREEIYFAGYTVDGTEYSVGEDAELLEGKWFWKGNTYCWRVETDTRQPEGVTRSVKVAIPVGWGRTLNFAGSKWRGIVEITADSGTWTVDTYAPEQSTVSCNIGRSETSLLIWNQIRRLAVYALVLLALTAGAYVVAVWKRESVIRFNKRHKGVLIFLAIAVAQLAFAMKYAGTDGLWQDELIEIGWSVQMPNVFVRAMTDAVPRPISEFLLGIWIAIAPYGERWLLLFPEIVTAIGIFFVGLCGRELKNVRTGVFAALFAAVSGTVLIQCSYEIRSYCLYFSSAAVLLYLYFRRYNSPGRAGHWENVMLFITLVVFAQSHYYAYVICGLLFLFDLASRFVLKVKKISMAPWIVLGICSVPIAVLVLKSGFVGNYVSDWQPVPNISSVSGLIDYLLDKSSQLRILLFLGIALAVGGLVRIIEIRANHDAQQKNGVEHLLVTVLPLYLIVFVITVMYIYGRVHIKASLWYNRYFCGLLPSVFVLCGYAVDWICALVEKISRKENVVSAVCYVFIGLLVFPSAITGWEKAAVRIREPYREAAEYIYKDINYIFNDSTVIIDTATSPALSMGWERYYITKYGRRDSLNLRPLHQMTTEDILQYDRIYVSYIHHEYTDELKQTLNKYYTKVSDNTTLKVAVYERNSA